MENFELKVVEWNVNGKTKNECKGELVTPIIQAYEDDIPDVVILTEYNIDINSENDFEQEMKKYYDKPDNNSNDIKNSKISIWIKKDINEESKVIGCSKNEEDINHIEVKSVLRIKNQKIDVLLVGVRMPDIKGSNGKTSVYGEERINKFNNWLEQIKYRKDQVIIICGDFNHGKYKQDKSYKKIHKYNYNWIREKMKDFDTDSDTLRDTSVTERKSKSGNIIKYPIDHIFVNGGKINKATYKCKLKDNNKTYSDHYMLVSEIMIPT